MKLLRDLTSGQRWGFAIWGVVALLIVGYALQQQFDFRLPADLDAQRSMAYAAWAMVATTTISILVGIVTLVFLGNNLIETRRTARAAEDAAKAAEKAIGTDRTMAMDVARAYPTVTEVSMSFDMLGRCHIEVIYLNAGQTPAQTVSLVATVIVEASVRGGRYEERATIESPSPKLLSDLPGSSAGKSDLVMSNDVARAIATLQREDTRARVIVEGNINYEDVFGRWHPQLFAYRTEIAPEANFQAQRALERVPDVRRLESP